MELKERLEVLAQGKFELDDVTELPALTQVVLPQIGNTEAHLRDDLIYTAFAHWILTHLYYSNEDMLTLCYRLLGEQHAFYKISEKDTDSVFMRSFSVLLLPLLLIVHRQSPYLQKTDIIYMKEKLLQYLALEQDRRGYVAGKGWAHTIAHIADALDDLAQCPEIEADDLYQHINFYSSNYMSRGGRIYSF